MKISIRQTPTFGGWQGYEGSRRAQWFPSEAEAKAWLVRENRAKVLTVYGPDLARLERGTNRTALSVTTTDVGLAAALVQVAEERLLPVLASPVLIGRAKRVPHVRVTVRYAEWDIEVSGMGSSVLLFSGHSAEGIDWLDENLQSGPRLGSSRAVEHRFAGAIIEGAAEAGLRVRVL